MQKHGKHGAPVSFSHEVYLRALKLAWKRRNRFKAFNESFFVSPIFGGHEADVGGVATDRSGLLQSEQFIERGDKITFRSKYQLLAFSIYTGINSTMSSMS